MNEQLLLTIINFYESHIEQLKSIHAEKEKVNKVSYAELERMNDDLVKSVEDWTAIAHAKNEKEIKQLKANQKLKAENKKLKKETKKGKRKK